MDSKWVTLFEFLNTSSYRVASRSNGVRVT